MLIITVLDRTHVGRFRDCLKTRETTPLEPDDEEFKSYAPGIGLIKDGPTRLLRAFFVDVNDDGDGDEGEVDSGEQG